jgi:hypothetical protein
MTLIITADCRVFRVMLRVIIVDVVLVNVEMLSAVALRQGPKSVTSNKSLNPRVIRVYEAPITAL